MLPLAVGRDLAGRGPRSPARGGPAGPRTRRNGVMANVTIGFGLVLAALGVGGYVATGRTSLTALIPLAFGLVLVVCGALARREALRKHAMHAAAVLGLLGF